MSALDWKPTDLSDEDLTFAVASSVVEEFAQGHNMADVLRELVQNEYDAGGSALTVAFRDGGVSVDGNGRVIDRAGWRRLSVMLGTGRVAGEDHDVPQKVNGIGSKNFGLRSLFLIGDRIYVRSGGNQTMLDLRRGAPRVPWADETTADQRGAHIFVPYREQPEGQLEAYNRDREARDIRLLVGELAPTLVKLADPRAPRSLRSVTVSSSRLGVALGWRQRVTLIRRHRLGGPVVERTIQMKGGSITGSGTAATKINELEYQRSFQIAPEYRARVFPDYFRVRGGRLRIGLSVPLVRKRVDVDARGTFFYPLGLARSSTGCALSVNAPFELDSDRSELIDPGVSSWNDWLLELAADFALDLLGGEWLEAFGGSAYLVLRQGHAPSIPAFAEKLSSRLSKRECWPARARARGSRRPLMRAADGIKIGASSHLDSLLEDERRLDARLNDERVKELARQAGIQDFTLASAIRLRCAGEDTASLETAVGNDAVLFYTDFPDPLIDAELQERFSKAFEAHRRKLTRHNRTDLSGSPTTLTAAGTLAAPSEPIWIMDQDVRSVAPVRLDRQLHPRLQPYKAIADLCKPFDTSAWARDVAGRAAHDAAPEPEREALYRHLLRHPDALTRATWPVLRRAPVVRDHRGDWVRPDELVQQRASGASRLASVLHFPSPQVNRNRALMRALKVRLKLTGDDLVRFAEAVATQPALSAEFEQTLYLLRNLLTPRTVRSLRPVAFLVSTQGGVVAPEEAYVRTPELLNAVGPDALFAAGHHVSIHRRLGCKTDPAPADVLAYLVRLRDEGHAPPRPDVIYPSLVQGLRAEGDTRANAEEPILFDGVEWHAPARVLLGNKHRQIFLGAVPVIAAGALAKDFEALGASTEPTDDHWRRFFHWIDLQSGSGIGSIPAKTRAALGLAYSKIGTLPEGIPERSRIFLDTTGRLHSGVDVRMRRFLVNDDPETAKVVSQHGLPIAFAIAGEAATHRFWTSSGVSRLSEARRRVRTEVGDVRPGPAAFSESRDLELLQRPVFASAVHAVAAVGGSQTATTEPRLRRQLGALSGIEFVTSLAEVYRIGGSELTVPTDVAIFDDRIVLARVRTKGQLYGLLARAVAALAESNRSLQQALSDSIFRILSCASTSEIEHYLAQRGVPWSARAGIGAELDLELEEEETESHEEVAESLMEQILRGSLRRRREPARVSERDGDDEEIEPPEPTEPRTFPPLEEVNLETVPPVDWVPRERGPGRGGGGGGWRPRTPAEVEADQELGLRGEELVFKDEVKRVGRLGHPESRVVWTSKADPAADHDIRSVADDGGDLFVEVKSTAGRHGRFEWPRSEFELALNARQRYVLCRVYEADSLNPKLRRVPDPVGAFLAGGMRLDLSTLGAELAPLDAEPPG